MQSFDCKQTNKRTKKEANRNDGKAILNRNLIPLYNMWLIGSLERMKIYVLTLKNQTTPEPIDDVYVILPASLAM